MKVNKSLMVAGLGALSLLLLVSMSGAKRVVKAKPLRMGLYGTGHRAGVNPLMLQVLDEAERLGANFNIVDGTRTVEEQTAALKAGASTFSDPSNAPHVKGLAVDLWTIPQDNDLGMYVELAKFIARAAANLGSRVRWGGAWEVLSPSIDPASQAANYLKWKRAKGEKPFVDMGHFELRES
jgi:hypothetical protein